VGACDPVGNKSILSEPLAAIGSEQELTDSRSSQRRTDASRLPLQGLRVVDLSGETTPHCGQILALFGADVVLVERGDTAGDRASFEWAAFNAGKRSLGIGNDPARDREVLEALASACDVWIDAGPARAMPQPQLSPQAVHVSITPFGLTGPHADWRSSELLAQAAGGLLYLSGDAEHPPAQVGIPVAAGVAGAQAACAALLALEQRIHTGRGARIDVSMQESVANLLFTTQFMAHVKAAPGRRGEAPLTASDRKITRRVMWKCADGFATWTLWTGSGMGRKNAQTFGWMRESGVTEVEELLEIPWDQMGAQDLTPELVARVNSVVGDFFSSLSKESINREALERRILLQGVQTPAEILDDEQLRARDAFRSLELADGRAVQIVGTPVRSTAYPIEVGSAAPAWNADAEEVLQEWEPLRDRGAAPVDPARGLPLEGVRVLDLGWAVVSPVTTKYLALFGADVVKLEFRGRPDPVRMTGPYPLGKPSMDGSAAYVSVNASKRSVGIDLNRPEARELVHKMAREADIICENFAPGTADRLGYGYDAFRALRPGVIMLSLSMQGQTGPRAAQPGLGNHLQAMSGIDHLTGFPDGLPTGPNQVLPDFIGPWIAIAALLAALEHRRQTGEGQYLDVAQLESIMLYVQPRLIEHQVAGRPPERSGNASRAAAPHGVYPVRGDDRWIAIAVETDAQWRALRTVLPDAARARFDADLGAQARLERSEELDAALASWTTDLEGDPLMHDLQSAGVPAHLVYDSSQLLRDPQLAFRQHYRPVEHGKLGSMIVDAPAFRIEGIEPRIEPGPRYAAHTAEVLAEWLGLNDDEIAEHVASGALVF
jgi:crotonobetainyl-CoA:carnitine CoA-transferase CaiB-like acyl-CoA transferase